MNIDERKKQWVDVSISLAEFDAQFVFQCQQLGRLDCEIIIGDQKIHNMLQKNELEEISHAFDLDRQSLLSHLWVLGIYELLRNIKEIAGDDHKLSKEIKNVYEHFRKIRIPLAKMRKAGDYNAEVLSLIPMPAITKSTGSIAWALDKDCYIDRITLADYFLDLLNKLRANNR